MIDANQIPDEVVEAAMDAWGRPGTMKDVIVAALNAWPGVTTTSWYENGVRKAVLNIPLPHETSDDA